MFFYSSDDDDDDDNYDDEDDEHDSDSDEDDEEDDFLRTLLMPSLLSGEVRFGPQKWSVIISHKLFMRKFQSQYWSSQSLQI